MTMNPRFPHWCRIIRKTASSPLVDEGGYTPLHDDYNPLGSDEDEAGGVSSSSSSVGSSSSSSSSSSEGEFDETVIYEGECRSYEKNTTSDKGEVISSQRGLSLPLNQDGWDALGVVPMEGDEVVVVHGTTHKEYGRVIDKNVATASFAGTHLIWRYGRN